VALLSNHAEVTNNNSGGALRTNGSAEVSIRDSLIAGNMAYNGGATDIGDVTVTNSTIANNTAGSPGDNGNSGGLRASMATVRNSTIVGNRCFNSDGCGAGADVGALVLKNSVLAGNTAYEFNGQPPGSAGNPGQPENCAGSTATDQGGNVESLSDCETGPASRQNANPNLGPLADNGGQTDTMALLAGSPAIGLGSSCEPLDQRGLSRSLAAPCDSGAYERVLCGGVAVNRFGTSGRDTVVGTSGADGILGLGGNDLLKGLAGNDSLCGGKGRDRLLGGKGRDKLIGGKGRDRLRGGPGRDRLRGGPGRDIQRQ
jgi:Ca2+-binding RTX toxin-like protein